MATSCSGGEVSACSYEESTLCILVGDTKEETVFYKDPDGSPVDLTGYVAKMEIRERRGDTGTAPVELSSPSDGLVITELEGRIDITISSAKTRNLENFRRAVWDLEIIAPDGKVTTLLGGPVEIEKDVTR